MVAKLQPLNYPGTFERNRTYIVTTISEAPYLMRRGPEVAGVKTNDAYNGFCRDLTEMLSHKLEIKCKYHAGRGTRFGTN